MILIPPPPWSITVITVCVCVCVCVTVITSHLFIDQFHDSTFAVMYTSVYNYRSKYVSISTNPPSGALI